MKDLESIISRIKNKEIFVHTVEKYSDFIFIAYSDTDYLKFNCNESIVNELSKIKEHITSIEFTFYMDKEINCIFRLDTLLEL